VGEGDRGGGGKEGESFIGGGPLKFSGPKRGGGRFKKRFLKIPRGQGGRGGERARWGGPPPQMGGGGGGWGGGGGGGNNGETKKKIYRGGKAKNFFKKFFFPAKMGGKGGFPSEKKERGGGGAQSPRKKKITGGMGKNSKPPCGSPRWGQGFPFPGGEKKTKGGGGRAGRCLVQKTKGLYASKKKQKKNGKKKGGRERVPAPHPPTGRSKNWFLRFTGGKLRGFFPKLFGPPGGPKGSLRGGGGRFCGAGRGGGGRENPGPDFFFQEAWGGGGGGGPPWEKGGEGEFTIGHGAGGWAQKKRGAL